MKRLALAVTSFTLVVGSAQKPVVTIKECEKDRILMIFLHQILSDAGRAEAKADNALSIQRLTYPNGVGIGAEGNSFVLFLSEDEEKMPAFWQCSKANSLQDCLLNGLHARNAGEGTDVAAQLSGQIGTKRLPKYSLSSCEIQISRSARWAPSTAGREKRSMLDAAKKLIRAQAPSDWQMIALQVEEFNVLDLIVVAVCEWRTPQGISERRRYILDSNPVGSPKFRLARTEVVE